MAARSIVLEKKCAEDSQVLRVSVSDDLIARKATLYLILFYGKPVQLLEKTFGMFYSTKFKDEFGCRVMYLLEWFDNCLWIACQ